MGWFWGAPAAAKPSTPRESAQDLAQPPSQPPAHTRNQARPPPETDEEVHKFLEELMGEVNKMKESDKTTSPSQQESPSNPPSAWATRWASSSISGSSTPTTSSPRLDDSSLSSNKDPTSDSPNDNDQPRLSPLAESILPTTMSCRSAFDMAFYCQSFGGQWNAIYRYGEMRSCGELWDDFFFCMRQQGTPPGEVKENMVREHYRRKELAKYGPGRPSSEDVWRERKERVAPGEAFAGAAEPPRVSDAEYQKWEMERTERIRKGLSTEIS